MAEKAGMKTGDILLAWRTRLGSGILASPFDMVPLWYEQASRAPVSLHGSRNERKRAWLLGADSWGITVRPNFTPLLLHSYDKAQELALAGNFSEAACLFRTAVAPELQNMPALNAWFLSHIAHFFAAQGNWPLVDQAYDRALAESADLNPEVRADIYRQWSDQFAARDDLPNAKKYRQLSLLEWQRLGLETIAIADTLLSIAEIELRQGDFDGAASHLNQSMLIGDRLAPEGIQAIVTAANLAVLYQNMGELDQAEQYYLKALRKEEQSFPVSSLIALTLNDLGVLYDQKGDLTQAEGYHRRALQIADRVSPGGLIVADILSSLAECLLQTDDLAQAEKLHRQSLAIREKLLPGTLAAAYDLAGLGRVARLHRTLGKAEEHYRRALAITETLGAPDRDRASFLVGLAAVMRNKRDYREAEALYQQALAIFGRVDPASIDRADTLAELAGTLYEDHQIDPALDLFRQAMDLAEDEASQLAGIEEDRPRYRAQRARYYHEYMAALIEQGQLQRAFELLERSRARTLLEMLSRQQIQSRTRQSSSANAALHPATLDLQAIQNLLDPGTVLLEYSLGDPRSYVWAVTDHSLEVYELARRRDIEDVASRVYRLLSFPNGRPAYARTVIEREYSAQARTLSRLVLQPVARLLPHRRVVIVGDGLLQYIPFAALPLPLENAPVLPLIVDSEVISLPSASILGALRRQAAARTTAPNHVAVFADPVFDRRDERLDGHDFRKRNSPNEAASLVSMDLTRSVHDLGLASKNKPYLKRLLYTRKEAEQIMAVMPPGRGMAVLGFEASRRTAMSSDLTSYRMVHFATHALVDNKHPELSGLVLSLLNQNGGPEDGFLKLHDIYRMKLPVDLVVLSGCETGLGEQINGEGLLGLTRGFMHAGATRVVASLWSVSDPATAALMAELYRAMEVDGLTPAAALRRAQISTRAQKQWTDPYYWAAFQLYGDWR